VRRILFGALLLAGALVTQPAPTAQAQITDYNCQQQFRQLAGPYMQQILWFANQQFNGYSINALGRPNLVGPVGAYPQYQGIVTGPGPAWNVANNFGATSLGSYGQLLAMTNNGLNAPQVTGAFIAGAGGFNNLGTANLATLAPLQQGLQGNVLTAAALRESVIGNRLSAAALHATLAAYPLVQADNMGSVVTAIQTWVANTCPGSTPDSSGSSNGSPSNGPSSNGPSSSRPDRSLSESAS
jgi:hypothetical protein